MLWKGKTYFLWLHKRKSGGQLSET
jgi:hypothetical protein